MHAEVECVTGVEMSDERPPLKLGVPAMDWWLDSMRLIRLRTKEALSSTTAAGLVEDKVVRTAGTT